MIAVRYFDQLHAAVSLPNRLHEIARLAAHLIALPLAHRHDHRTGEVRKPTYRAELGDLPRIEPETTIMRAARQRGEVVDSAQAEHAFHQILRQAARPPIR